MAASLVGRTVGKYQVIAELGRGQHSIVYKAWQPSLERYVALKVLHRYDQETLRKFQTEAILTAKLIEQGAVNIRQVYEVGQTADGYLFVAMEYIHDSLRGLLERAKRRGKTIRPVAAANLLLPIAQALDSIHRLGWVHLDVKPQNILINRSGRAVLADLGIAQRRGARTNASTPPYASPEQADGNRPVGPWSDIYSLGVVLYEAVTGRLPFRGDLPVVILHQHLTEKPPLPRSITRHLSAGQERAILRALSKDPRSRPRSATEFLNAVIQTRSRASDIFQIPSDLLRQSSNRRIPRPVLIGGLVAAILIILLALGWLLQPYLTGGVSDATPTAAATVMTASPSPSAAPTTAWTPRPSRTPTATRRPTSTLAPTPTRTRRPKPTSTRKPTPTPGRTATP